MYTYTCVCVCVYIYIYIYIYIYMSSSWITGLSWWTSLHNSIKLWAMPSRATQQTGHGEEFWQNVVHWKTELKTTPVILTARPQTVWEVEKIWHQKMSAPRKSEGVQYATGEEWRAITNNSRKNKAAGPKQEWHTLTDVSGSDSEVQCCKDQYCIGMWNVRSMNQGKLKVFKQEMARVNIDILGISELNWTGMSGI